MTRRALRHREAHVLQLVLVDVLAIGWSMRLGYLLRFKWEVLALEHFAPAPYVEYLKPLAVLLVLLPILFYLFDLYRTDEVHTPIEVGYATGMAVSIATLVVLSVGVYYREFSYSRVAFAFNWAIAIALCSASRLLLRRLLHARYAAGKDLRRTVIVGEPKGFLLEKLRTDPAFGVDVLGVLDRAGEDPPGGAAAFADAGPLTPTLSPGERETGAEKGGVGVVVRSARTAAAATRPLAALPRLGSVASFPRLLEEHGIDEVLIVDPALTHEELLAAIHACEARGGEVRLVPPIYDLLVSPGDLTYVQGVPFLRVDEKRYKRLGFLAKRLFDAAASAVALVLLAPLFAAVAAAIKATSPGPVFFVQTRAGEGGRPFRMLKFRTMVANAEARLAEVVDVAKLEEPVVKVVDVPRVTRVGRWLRRLSLDELPQLVNVLRGDMSLVGPRPEELRMVERYDVWQRRRLKVKPGLTGLQQVERRGTTSLNERVRLDILYIRKQSFLLDLVIILRTVWVVLTGRGAT